MRLERNLYMAVASVVAISLVVAGFVGRRNPGFGTGWSGSANILFACCAVGSAGVIVLCLYWVRLVGAITSITNLLKQNKLPAVKSEGGLSSFGMAKINELNMAICERFSGCSGSNLALEKQINDVQIKIQLAQRQKRNTEAIIYSIRDAVVVVDEFDRLLMANEAAGKLFNFDFKRSQQKPISEVITSSDGKHKEFVDFLRQSRQSKVRASRREMVLNVSEENSEGRAGRTFDSIVSCVYDDKEQVCGIVAVLHDITREKEISQMKNDFVSHVSHELKTPLASISAYSEMLLDGEAKDGQTAKEFYEVIQSQAKRLNRLIEDILNISRIESGLIKVEKKPISLTILIEEQFQMIKSYAEEKNISVTWGEVGQKPIVFDQVYADKDMISQVVVNLLSNAVKYTPAKGSIKVKTEVDEGAGVIRVSVTDTGVGIPESEMKHVFDKFYRVEANKNMAKGTGLGLNLVKQIVEKVHNGKVFVTSKVGQGSTFGFELPLATADVAGAVS